MAAIIESTRVRNERNHPPGKPGVFADASTDCISQGCDLKAEPESLLTWKPGPNDKVLRLKSDKQDFIDSVKSREETLEPAEVGHRVTSLCHLGHIAIQTGRKLTWDPDLERFANNSEADALIDKPIHRPRQA